MPAQSKKQQRFMGMVHSYQKGEFEDAPAEVKKVAKTISKKDAKAFASTEHDDLGESQTFKQFLQQEGAEINESTKTDLELLKELQQLVTEAEKKKKVGKNTAAKVYHRDYLKTRNKEYRQYDAEEHKESK